MRDDWRNHLEKLDEAAKNARLMFEAVVDQDEQDSRMRQMMEATSLMVGLQQTYAAGALTIGMDWTAKKWEEKNDAV